MTYQYPGYSPIPAEALQPVWASGTNNAVKLSLQDDGNVVLSDANGNPVWSTMANGGTDGATGNYQTGTDKAGLGYTPLSPLANNWTELKGLDTGGRPISAMLAYPLNPSPEWPKDQTLLVALGDPTARVKQATSGTGDKSYVRSTCSDCGGLAIYDFDPSRTERYGKVQDLLLGTYDGTGWTVLMNTGWNSPVTTLVGINGGSGSSPTTAKEGGVAIGLNDGRMVLWEGGTAIGGSVDLYDTSWDGDGGSGVATMVLAPKTITDSQGNTVVHDGLIVGLKNGDVKQWSGTLSGGTTADPAAVSGDWTSLAEQKKPYLTSGDFDCTRTALKCSNPGTLEDAVTYAKSIATAAGGIALGTWQSPGGVGSASDPLFKNTDLQAPAGADYGSYKTFAIYLPIKSDRLNVTASPTTALVNGSPKQVGPTYFTGKITQETGGSCGSGATGNAAGTGSCSVLEITKYNDAPELGFKFTNPVKGPELSDKNVNGTTPWLLESGTILGWGDDRVWPGTKIVKQLAPNRFLLESPPQTAGTDANGVFTKGVTSMKATQLPSAKFGIDVNPVLYGYAYVPDGWLDKFKSGKWTFGALLAAELGPSLQINLGPNGSLASPEWDKSFSFSTPGPLGVDSLTATAGIKLGLSATLNGLPGNGKFNPTAHAYGVPGMLLAYNTQGAPGEFQAEMNWYWDVDASDFKDVSGISVTGTLTPYVNLMYGIVTPPTWGWFGGWSLFDVTAGYENPAYLTLCVDTKQQCPGDGANSGVASFYGVINDGTFTQGMTGKPNPGGSAGKVLTVTRPALYNPTKIGPGQLVTGPGVAAGTTITSKKGTQDIWGWDQYYVDTEQAVGAGAEGAQPRLTAYVPGSTLSATVGAEGLLTFHAGALEAFSSLLTYDAKVPLYQVNKVFKLI
jgi:hypothetical protein